MGLSSFIRSLAVCISFPSTLGVGPGSFYAAGSFIIFSLILSSVNQQQLAPFPLYVLQIFFFLFYRLLWTLSMAFLASQIFLTALQSRLSISLLMVSGWPCGFRAVPLLVGGLEVLLWAAGRLGVPASPSATHTWRCCRLRRVSTAATGGLLPPLSQPISECASLCFSLIAAPFKELCILYVP